MKYPGSKARFTKQLLAVVASARGDRTAYLEPFVGGGNSFAAVAPLFARSGCGDGQEDIALLWQAVAGGWLPPENVSEDEYAALRHAEPSALRGFVGVGCSFAGKWFGGYARGNANNGGPRNYAAESRRALLRQQPAFAAAAVIRHCGFQDWNVSADMVVYCDPPYAGTLKYRTDVDHALFWRTAEQWAHQGAAVLVSEQTAPAGWAPVAALGRLNSTALAQDRAATTEYIFARE